MNEMRNELLLIKNMMIRCDTETGKENQQLDLSMLLERFQYDIERQLEDIDHKKKELENNLKLLESVRKDLGVK